MCMAELAMMYEEAEPATIETRLGDMMMERRKIHMAIEHERQALSDITEKIECLKGEEARR